eukprot:4890307-Alexandrium_andersonii.AAC.1
MRPRRRRGGPWPRPGGGGRSRGPLQPEPAWLGGSLSQTSRAVAPVRPSPPSGTKGWTWRLSLRGSGVRGGGLCTRRGARSSSETSSSASSTT